MPGAGFPAVGNAREGNGHEKSRRDAGSAGMEAALPGELLRRVDVGGVRGHAVAAPAGEDVHVQVGH